MRQAKNVLREICNSHVTNLSYSEAKEALETLDNKLEHNDDFYFEIDGMEFRIVHEDEIWDIYVEEIKQRAEECYDLKLNDMPSWLVVEVDWEQTAKNCYVDGYGHTFSGYDGEELNTNGWYIFRTN